MGLILGLLGLVAGIGSLVCYIMVLVQMFKHENTGLAIACIVLIFCVGIGGIIAFVYGWMKAGEWDIKNIMIAWTACIVVGMVMNGASFLMAPPAIPEM